MRGLMQYSLVSVLLHGAVLCPRRRTGANAYFVFRALTYHDNLAIRRVKTDHGETTDREKVIEPMGFRLVIMD
jgi:hypothetical protein